MGTDISRSEPVHSFLASMNCDEQGVRGRLETDE